MFAVVAIVRLEEVLPFAGGVTDAGMKLQVIVTLGVEQFNATAELKLLIDQVLSE